MIIKSNEKEPPKIMPDILIVTGIFPPDIGGPASYVPKIANELCKRGWKVTVITLSDSLSHDDSCYPFRVIRILRPQSKMRRIPQTVWTIAKYAKIADVIFANGLFPESVIASKLRRKPLVMKIVSDWAWERSIYKKWIDDFVIQFQKKRYTLKIECLKSIRTFSACNADIILTPSKYLSKIVGGWGVPLDRINVVYNAIDCFFDNLKPIELPQFNGFTIITIGRLLPLKGINRLIKVISSQSDIRLIIVGDGPEMKKLQKLSASLKMNGKIIFTGQVSQATVYQYLMVADLFILNSDVEGLPFVVLEAMAVGVPVVATDVGGTSEVVQNEINGLLVSPHDDEALRSAIRRMIDNPDERKRFASAGQFTISEHFQWNKLVELTEKHIISAIK